MRSEYFYDQATYRFTASAKLVRRWRTQTVALADVEYYPAHAGLRGHNLKVTRGTRKNL